MSANKEQKRQKDNPQDKIQAQNKGTKPSFGKNPKPFEQFSGPKQYMGGAPSSFNAFHRRLNTRRSSGGK